ncbi:MAG: amidohydrolase, partial [Burkholderiales bacterium]
GVLENPKPDVIFGLHVFAGIETGTIAYRPGPTMASADRMKILVSGRQTHAALPWRGVDPIVISSQIILGLQTIISRQVDLSLEPAVLSIGAIKGGIRDNIIPDKVEMLGTVRTFDEGMRADIRDRIRTTVEMIAKSAGAEAEVFFDSAYPVTVNDIPLTERMLPTLQRVAGTENVVLGQKITGYEDFSHYQKKIPGFFYFVGIDPKGTKRGQSAPNHSPRFYVDESALVLGVRSLAHLALDYMR